MIKEHERTEPSRGVADLLSSMAAPGWRFDPELFVGAPQGLNIRADIGDAEKLCEAAKIDHHRFFELCRSNDRALEEWCAQELITSSMFSQALAAWLSTIPNCHVRAVVSDVYVGEHHRVDGTGFAEMAHPNLAFEMCTALGVDTGKIKPLEPTLKFLRRMYAASEQTMYGCGFFAIGNELMLIDEYRGIIGALRTSSKHGNVSRRFLTENIRDDSEHHRQLEVGASVLADMGYSVERFQEGASDGVAARIEYYDELLRILEMRKA